MRILINCSGQSKGGSTQVAISIIRELQQFPENEYFVFLNNQLVPSLDITTFASNFKFYYFDFGAMQLRDIGRRAKILSRYEKEIDPDCVLTVFGPLYWRPKAVSISGYALGLYIYPESPIFENYTLKQRILFFIKKQLQLWFFRRDVDVYFTELDDVSNRIKKIFNTENVTTITNNCSSFFREPLTYTPILGRDKRQSIRLLTISAYYTHKNLDIIPAILEDLSLRGIDHAEFVLTLSQEDYCRVIPEKYRHKVHNVGFIQPANAPSLYSECDIMFLPSLCECFSASYPEAMMMGLPIITTDLGFAHSICGKAALYYEPKNPVGAAKKIAELIDNKGLAADLVHYGKMEINKFDTPHERAYKILELCQSTINKRK